MFTPHCLKTTWMFECLNVWTFDWKTPPTSITFVSFLWSCRRRKSLHEFLPICRIWYQKICHTKEKKKNPLLIPNLNPLWASKGSINYHNYYDLNNIVLISDENSFFRPLIVWIRNHLTSRPPCVRLTPLNEEKGLFWNSWSMFPSTLQENFEFHIFQSLPL
jgi:hypothetical protein